MIYLERMIIMPEQLYKEALKRGQKEKRQCVSQGHYPYLPVLDTLVSKERLNSGKRLGVMQIPAEFIVGTKTEGRTNAFSINFMPLLADGTEFAAKWKDLCKAHLEEGIREPIKVYEYMNRYYVEEGNKRVSVLKFFGAVSIPAQVVRILPPEGEAKELKLYYEFLDFYRATKINYIEFSRLGSFAKLLKLLGKTADEQWSEIELSIFRSNYYYFCQLLESMGGETLKCTPADAMLSFIQVYGYESLREKTGKELKQDIQKLWEEFKLLGEEETIDLLADPAEIKKKSLLQKLFDDEAKEAKVAFVYDKTPMTSGWTYGHELGRQHVQKAFGGRIVTTAYENALEDDAEAVIRQALADGNNIVFTTSPKFLDASLAAAVDNPEAMILNCSLNKSHRYIRTYYARMYEVKFIIGAIAGTLAENHKVGYLCDYPIYGQIAGINAFALGVQMVNPGAKVYLEWSCVDGVSAAMKRLRDRGITLISSQDFSKADGDDGRREFGLYRYDENGRSNLAMPLWNWGVYYEKLIQSILNRTLQSEYETTRKALNYYWGMSAGVVEVIRSNRLPAGVVRLIKLLTDSICSGLHSPFNGPFYTQSGEVIDSEGQGLTLEEIITMDWLAANVEGNIPVYEQLNEEGKATVESAGAPVPGIGG